MCAVLGSWCSDIETSLQFYGSFNVTEVIRDRVETNCASERAQELWERWYQSSTLGFHRSSQNRTRPLIRAGCCLRTMVLTLWDLGQVMSLLTLIRRPVQRKHENSTKQHENSNWSYFEKNWKISVCVDALICLQSHANTNYRVLDQEYAKSLYFAFDWENSHFTD
jgi:hypothetical protein